MASSPNLHHWIVLYLCLLCFQVTLSDCPGNWLTVNTTGVPSQTCYRIFTRQSLSFDGASAFCQSRGGFLARDNSSVVHNQLLPNVIAASAAAPSNYWFGLTDNITNTGNWVWLGGPNVGRYRNFATRNVVNTPNRRDCGFVAVVGNDFKWQITTNCNQSNPFICQRDINAPALYTTTARPPLNCSAGWTGFPAQRWCIKLYSTPVTWVIARMQCRQDGADLVRINNTDMSTFVNNLIRTNRGVYWIGLNDRKREGFFSWLDDTTRVNYSNWNAGMPNNSGGNENCVIADGFKNNKWDDLDCNSTNRFICQKVPFGGRPFFNTASTPVHQNCGPGWEDVTGSDTCIAFFTNVLSWQDALADCRLRGGDLASISGVQEQAYLLGRVNSFASDLFWIGANDRDTEDGWQWSDGTPFAFLNWGDNQPNNRHNSDCTVMSQNTGKWNDVPCESRNGYICKKKGRVTLPSVVTTTTPPNHLPADSIFACPRGWDNFRGSCYKVVQIDTGIDWTTASSSCSSSSMQGALAAIIDADENKFVFSLLPNGNASYAWIGLQDPQENTFTWVDGTPVQYTNWEVGEPNNIHNEDCVVMKSKNGKWNDAHCDNTYRFYICKKSKSIQPRVGSDDEQGCTNGSLGYGAQCYSFVSAKKNFFDAQKDCRARSKNLGNLATVDSGHLQAFLAAELDTQPSTSYWIGLQQNNYIYKWQSNWTVSFTYWGKNHTGIEQNTCVGMQRTGLWANYQCSQVTMSYICESPRPGFTTPATMAAITRLQNCPPGWSGYGTLCYQVFSVNISDSLSWGDARDFCAKQASGGSLVTINNNATQAWLNSNLIAAANASGHFWIGLNDRDTESGYVWVDDSPFLYSNWGFRQPDDRQNREDCVEWVLPQNFWNDDYCYIAKDWICQIPRGSPLITQKPAPTGVQSSQCGNSSWTLYDNNCYYVSSPDGYYSYASWFDARWICMMLGADLASITGDDENGFVTSLISKNPFYGFWIGLNDLEMDAFRWTDRSPVMYVSWARNEPNDNYGGEDCVVMNKDGTWNDLQCQSNLGYVCKKRPGNNPAVHYIPFPPTGGCPRDFVSLPSLSFCYQIGGTTNSTRQNYDGALAMCEKMVHQSTLASIHSSLEEKFILILLANLRTPAWIGFNDRRIRNQFEWVDNLVVSYSNWGRGQPDENLNDPRPEARRDCVDVEVGRGIGTWNDRRCDTRLAYICEARKGSTFPTTAPNSTGCHAGYQRFRNSCYKYFKDAYNWTAAETICKNDGGNLATVSSSIEQAYVEIMTGHFNDSLQFWLGLQYSHDSSSFSWADGWPVRFSNWGHGEPDIGGGQSCVTDMVDAQWQVVNCSSRYSFVCEVNLGSPPPPRVFNQGRCPDRSWLSYNGNCYRIEAASPKSWAAANSACTILGASLASIHSDDEAHALTNFIGTGSRGQDVWIGLFKGQGSGFSWYDGTELEYLNWAAGEPNDPESTLHQDCGKMRNQDGAWADTDCFDQNAYLCKTPQVFVSSTSPGQGAQTLPNKGALGNSNDMFASSTSPGQGAQTLPNKGALGNSNDSSSLSGGSVAGIVIGVLVLVAVIAVIAFVAFRYTRGQNVPSFSKQQLSSTTESGFDNASYSTSGGVKVNVSDA